jgi:hypothetical protein
VKGVTDSDEAGQQVRSTGVGFREQKLIFFSLLALCFCFSLCLAVTFGFLSHEIQVIWTAGTSQALMLAGIGAITLLAIEYYTTSQR